MEEWSQTSSCWSCSGGCFVCVLFGWRASLICSSFPPQACQLARSLQPPVVGWLQVPEPGKTQGSLFTSKPMLLGCQGQGTLRKPRLSAIALVPWVLVPHSCLYARSESDFSVDRHQCSRQPMAPSPMSASTAPWRLHRSWSCCSTNLRQVLSAGCLRQWCVCLRASRGVEVGAMESVCCQSRTARAEKVYVL